jgi:hypothetical protein
MHLPYAAACLGQLAILRVRITKWKLLTSMEHFPTASANFSIGRVRPAIVGILKLMINYFESPLGFVVSGFKMRMILGNDDCISIVSDVFLVLEAKQP